MSNNPFDKTATVLMLCLLFFLNACSRTSPEPVAKLTFNHEEIGPGERLSDEISIPAGQYAIIRIEGHNAELTPSYSDPDTSESQSASLLYFRLNPLFLTIQPAKHQRNIQLHLDPDRTTNAGSVDVQISFFSADAPNHAKQLEAYSSLSSALTTSEIPFEERSYNLKRARTLLDELGRTEDALWADFYLAYLTYWHPFDLPTALSITEKVVQQSEELSYPRIHLASLQLLGAILIERGKDTPEIAKEKALRGQQVLETVQNLANEMDLPYESAWALNNSGIGYYYQDINSKAASQYDAALKITRALGDELVSQMILTNRVFANENSGQYFEAIQTLEEASDFLSQTGNPLLVAGNHRELGRLYRIVADYPSAINNLAKAQQMYLEAGDLGGESRTLISLGLANMQMGRFKIARSQLELGLEKAEQNGGGMEMRDVSRSLADIERKEGNSEAARQRREQQLNFIDSPAAEIRYQYDLAMDMLANNDQLAASRHFEICAAGKDLEEDMEIVQMCALHLAKIGIGLDQHKPDIQKIRSIAHQTMKSPVIARALASQQLLAEIESDLGNDSEALELSANLVEKMLFYRDSLPGVMGAWFWESRKNILEFYFNRFMDSQKNNAGYAEANFLAYIRLQNLGIHGPDKAESIPALDTNELNNRKVRELIAKGVSAQGKDEQSSLQNQLDAALLEATEDAALSDFDPEHLQNFVKSIPQGTGIISFYFGENKAFAWLLTASGIEQIQLQDGATLHPKLAATKTNFRVIGDQQDQYKILDELGSALLTGFSKDLPLTLYFQTSGPLTGFPLDALRLNNKFLSETHQVAQILDIRQFKDSSVQVAWQDTSKQLLLAGNPVANDQDGVPLPATLQELEEISTHFESSKLVLLEGSHLTLEALTEAMNDSPGIIHIASHAVLNLEYPELSSILLSGQSTYSGPLKPENEYLMPIDIGNLNLNGSLVVLSACETAGSQQFSFDSNLGFVSEFMNSGASFVVASLWPVGDRFALDFMTHFYANLAQDSTPVQALTLTKRSMLENSKYSNLNQWAAFQLYKK